MEDYEKKYKDALAKAREIHRNEVEKRFDMEWLFPELKESENEKIRKALIRFHKSTIDVDGIKGDDIIAWLEKQGQTFTKKDVDDAYLKGISDAKHELGKQGEQKSVLDFKASNWYVSKVDGKIHDMTYNPADKVEPFDKYEGLTDFERTLADICIGWIDKELGWKQYIKDNADVLLKIAIKKFNSIQDAPFEQKPADKNATTKQDGWLEIPFGAKDSELQESTYYIPDGFHAEIDDDKVIIKKGEKSAAWSEEDENYLQSAENACEYQYGKNTSTILWLKSLKDRIGG